MKFFMTVFLTILVQTTTAFAAGPANGVLLSLGLLKYDEKTEGPTLGNSDQRKTYTDLKLGTMHYNPLYLGVIYSTRKVETASSSETRTLYGVTAGYHKDGFYLDGSYFLSGVYESGTTSLKEGSGIGIDVGYHMMINSNAFFGPMLSYKSITYKKLESGSSSVNQDNKESSGMYPMLVLGISF